MNLDSSICRACLLSDSRVYSLQQKAEIKNDYTLLEMFNMCTHLETPEEGILPQCICETCYNDLQTSFDFLIRAAASHQFLKAQYEECDMKKETEFYVISDGNNVSPQEEPPDKWEESLQIEQQQKDNNQSHTDGIKSELVGVEIVHGKQGFHEQFGQFLKTELAAEGVYLDSNEESTRDSDDGASDDNAETEKSVLKDVDSRDKTVRKTFRNLKIPPVKTDQTVECNNCGKILKQMSIRHHLKRCQKEDKQHLCSSCPKSFAVLSDLRNHMRTHDKDRERRYVCTECGKRFFEKQALHVHMTRHVGVKNFHCKMCPKQFVTKKSLDVHEFTHNRELGRFICKHCDKRFSSRSDLRVHERFHTGDYPYQCEFCDKSYAVKSHYNYHLAKHKGVTYKCDQCDKEFINRGSLTAHKFKHEERMPHECPICKKGFTSPFKLNRHKSCHNKAKEDECGGE